MSELTVIRPSCRGIFGKVFGHKFRPRFNEMQRDIPVDSVKATMATVGEYEDTDKVLDSLANLQAVDTIYACDVCRRCGMVVYRPTISD